jgi:mannose-6-phosphate isomerase-like protein (cupin superfamily)
MTAPSGLGDDPPMSLAFGSLLDSDGWVPMAIEGQQENTSYLWEDGGLLADSPADFAATFGGAMFVSSTPIDVQKFNRNPLKVIPNFVVPRHHHNIDETILVFEGEYSIEHGDPDNPETVRVGPGMFFTSRAGTPYTMTSGPEGVTYIETWGVPVANLKTVWYDHGWKHR